MNAIVQEAPTIFGAFLVTLELTALAAVGALVVGTITAIMWVSPLPPVRWLAASYIRLIRNSPLTVVFFIVVFGLPQLGIRMPFFVFAVFALTVYTATFVAEVLRSGIQAVPVGQVEAARSIGMSFGRTLRHIVLPQAARSVVPAMASVAVSLFKNTSIASAFGVAEATGTMTSLINIHSSAVLWIMFSIAATYVVIAFVIGRGFARLERRVEVLQ